MKPIIMIAWLCCLQFISFAQSKSKTKTSQALVVDPRSTVDKLTGEIESQIIEARHWLHQNAELSNREFKTSEYIAKYLQSLGIETKTGIAHTGVVGLIKGGLPGPTILLRADMDALPVTERADIPWKSVNKDVFNGMPVGVMHACGHDTHVSMLMGAAKVLNSMKDQIKGNVKLVFQPAEEGAPKGEKGGAELMINEGVMENPKVDVAFGMHIASQSPVGHIIYKPEGWMASVDGLYIKVKGKQVHGSTPWGGVDPVVIGSQIVNALQTIVSRQIDISTAPAVVTVATFHAGVRGNIIPEEAELGGTIRCLDANIRKQVHEKIKHIAITVAESMGGTAEPIIEVGYPVTYNDPALTAQMLPTFKRVLGDNNVTLSKAIMPAEDFSFFGQKVPALFVSLGGMAAGSDPTKAPAHHTPDFYVDDSCMKYGIKVFCNFVLDYGDQWKPMALMSAAPAK